ncbi:hypothetical protein V2J09_016060, partial [Rumex salicifolius]
WSLSWVPTAIGRLKAEKYNGIHDKVSQRLQGWKARSLLLASRVTLATSVLSSIPLYSMQSAYLPRSVCDSTDQSIRSFIWGSTSARRRIHLLAWDKISLPKAEGGLGLCPMRHLNTAMLAKIGWRTIVEPQSLWSYIIRSKYCNGRADVDIFTRSHNASRVWQGLTYGAQIPTKGGSTSLMIQGRTISLSRGLPRLKYSLLDRLWIFYVLLCPHNLGPTCDRAFGESLHSKRRDIFFTCWLKTAFLQMRTIVGDTLVIALIARGVG